MKEKPNSFFVEVGTGGCELILIISFITAINRHSVLYVNLAYPRKFITAATIQQQDTLLLL